VWSWDCYLEAPMSLDMVCATSDPWIAKHGTLVQQEMMSGITIKSWQAWVVASILMICQTGSCL